MPALNGTHDPSLRSWVPGANAPGTDFPIQNLPHGVFRRAGEAAAAWRGGVAIGDVILDMEAAVDAGLFQGVPAEAACAAAEPALNRLMAMGNAAASALRARLSEVLREGSPAAALAARILVPMAQAEMRLPCRIGAFTDFLTSTFHTERGGRRSRPEAPLPPNFKHLPVAYNSRATSVRASGEAVRRPNGQRQEGPDGRVVFAPSDALDFELEVGLFIGPGNPLGEPVPIGAAREHIWGFCLLNDWSARDIQRWESVPLGPFLSKSLSTTISPWVVTAEAMAPFAAPAFPRGPGDPAPLPYLACPRDQAEGLMDIRLEALLLTPAMREAGQEPARITRTNFRNMYWTFAQMVTHHMSNGCNLQPGDLLGSGTASGAEEDSRACYSEITEGRNPLALPNGETRLWLEDGDEVIFRGRAEKPGFASIGFGECRGRIDPAPAWPTAA